MAVYYKPQSPIQSGEDFIYPITTADQVILSDGSRLEKNGQISIGGGTVKTVSGIAPDSTGNVALTASDVGARPSNWTPTAAEVGALAVGGTAADSSKLGGKPASEYALKTKTVPTSRTVNEKVLSENITLVASDVGAVPTSRKVNNKALSADISLSAGDVGAVPTSRTINGKALSSDISLSSSDVGALASGGTATNSSKLEGNTLAQIMLKAYPVGAIYISTSSTSPASLFGGSWEQLTDRFLLGAGNAYGAGSAGGESTHTLTRYEIPNYKIGDLAVMVPAVHGNWSNGGIIACGLGDASQSKPGIADRSNNIIHSGIQYGWEIDSYGGGSAHNNMPPYLAVYMWKRVS